MSAVENFVAAGWLVGASGERWQAAKSKASKAAVVINLCLIVISSIGTTYFTPAKATD